MDSQLQKLKDLQERLDAIVPLEGARTADELALETAFLRLVFRAKVVFANAREFRGPLTAIVVGGTNVGKSEIFNAISGRPVSRPDPRAGRTRRPAVFTAPQNKDFLADLRFLEGYGRSPLADPDDLNRAPGGEPIFHHELDEGALPHLVLVDSPDIDSNRTDNLATARHLLAACDAVVFVTSPSKYNDEACVSFLQLARDLGRETVVAFNLLGSEAETVTADFRATLEGDEEMLVVEIPRFPPGVEVFGRMTEAAAPLLQRLAALESKKVSQEQARRSLAYVATKLCSVVEAITAEVDKVESLLEAVQGEEKRLGLEYAAELEGEDFFELELVFREVLDHFNVPVVDDVLKAPSRAISWIVRKIQGRDSTRSRADDRVARRKDKDRRRLAEGLEGVRLSLARRLARDGSDPLIGAVGRRVAEGPLGASLERAVEDGWERREADFLRWKEQMRTEMIERIEASPNVKVFIRSSKAVLQLGAGIFAAVLTGGLGPTDLVSGPLAAKFMQYVLETFGSAYFTSKRAAYRDLHVARLTSLATEFILTPLEAALPARPDAQELAVTLKKLSEIEIP